MKVENGMEKCECLMCRSVHDLRSLDTTSPVNGMSKSHVISESSKTAAFSSVNGNDAKSNTIHEGSEIEKNEKENNILICDQNLSKIKPDLVANSNKTSELVINN